MQREWRKRWSPKWAAVALLAIVVAAAVAGCAKKGAKADAAITTEPVERHDIAVTVEATGTVEPVNLVEVKSKASGLITKMPVEIGSTVKSGDLLAQIDPRDVRNSYDQARASLVSAQAKARVARDQKTRADNLAKDQIITATEHEAAELEDASAQASLVAARTNLDLAKQRLEDATVRAPVDGTILAKPVSVGQVISSATSSVSGGTTLLQMADLHRIRMRALVVETDIGKVHEAQTVTVVVDAYPQRTFEGTVEKIEPQAVVSQSVTQFPVLISISNEEGLLMPGMNGEVTMLVEQRRNVLAVPVDGIRNAREIASLAKQLGVSTDSIGAGRRGQQAAGGAGEGAASGAGAASGGAAGAAAGGDVGLASAGRRADAAEGARFGAGAGSRDGAPRDSTRRGRRGRGAWSGGGAGAGTGASGAADASASTARSRPQVAIVKTAKGYQARMVRIGLMNFDYAEVLSGLNEGDQVVLLGTVEMQQQRSNTVSRIRQGVGGGITGSGGGGARMGGGGGGGGGR